MEDYKLQYKVLGVQLREEIAHAKTLTDTVSIHDVFISAENIISVLAYLIGPLTDLENAYRTIIVGHMADGDSHAKSEAKAKASEEYREYQKLKMLCELGNEQIMVLKKFKDELSLEYKRS